MTLKDRDMIRMQQILDNNGLVATLKAIVQILEDKGLVLFPNDRDYQAIVTRDMELISQCAHAVSKGLDGKMRA